MTRRIVRSWDIFDTLVTRRCASPEGIFDLMSATLGDAFAPARIEAERAAPGLADARVLEVTAAAREAWEEAGIDPAHLDVKHVFTDDHGPWRYDTVIAHTHGDAGAFAANAESAALQWVPLHEVDDFDLHPGLRSAWPTLTCISSWRGKPRAWASNKRMTPPWVTISRRSPAWAR